MATQATIYTATAFSGGSAVIFALLKSLKGVNLAPTDVSSIVYSIHKLGKNIGDGYAAVTGHTNVSLTVADVMFAAEDRVYNGVTETVNFEWRIPNNVNNPFPDRLNWYELRIDFTPSLTGNYFSPLVVNFKVI